MSAWSESIFPRFPDWSGRDNNELKELRTQALATAQGHVLEMGFGTGLNLLRYPASVAQIVAVDPNPGMARIAHRRMQERGMTVEHHQISAESQRGSWRTSILVARSDSEFLCPLAVTCFPA
jgi:ubiquinone/menaquinone biosynthesis C-methylase UbiE